MCSSRKHSYSPHRRDWNFLGGGWEGAGFVRPNHLKKCMGLNWNVQRGEGGMGNLGLRYGYFLELHNLMCMF